VDITFRPREAVSLDEVRTRLKVRSLADAF
jgi:hypothetical protein